VNALIAPGRKVANATIANMNASCIAERGIQEQALHKQKSPVNRPGFLPLHQPVIREAGA
jgi:hypothetical protein